MNCQASPCQPRPIGIRRQQGATMIEVLVAIVVISVGLLGIAALQLMAMKNSQGALQDSLATMYTYSILDAMRANPTAARNGDYDVNAMCSAPVTGNDQVTEDKRFWINAMQQQLGDTACGTVVCAGPACRVTITWDDSGNRANPEQRSMTTETEI